MPENGSLPHVAEREPPVIQREPTPDASSASEKAALTPPVVRSATSAQPPSLPAAREEKPGELIQSETSPSSPLTEQGVPAAVSAVVVEPMQEPPRFTTDGADLAAATATDRPKRLRWYRWPGWLVGRTLDFGSLTILLAVVAAIPIVQFASLGYLLNSAANLARGEKWSKSFPGLRLAGKLGTFVLLATLTWLPVWFVTDLSYTAQLLQPGSPAAFGWRIGAFAITFAWVIHVGWAAMRGGRWWHFLWPAPLRFMAKIWRPSTWRRASDSLYELASSLSFPKLWWLGARGAAGAFVWTVVPVSMMIIGQRADAGGAGVLGFIGAVAMMIILLYLPFLQIQLAKENRFVAIFDVRSVRRRFLYAPLAHAVSLLLLCLLCIPLYLLRIEATPAELLWAPSLVFVLFMLPAKLMLGAAMGYADGRQHRKKLAKRHWSLRWPARVVALASVIIYVGALYVAQLIAGQGAFVMYFQHAFLVPAPLISS